MKKFLSLMMAGLALAAWSTPAAALQDEATAERGRVSARNEVRRDRRERREDVTLGDEINSMRTNRRLTEIESLERQCFEEINRQREAAGLPRFRLNLDLLWVARDYSRRMAEEGFFSHADPGGRIVRERVSEAGIRWRVLGENLSSTNGYINPVAASVSGWMNSPGHRRNILAPDFEQTAIGAWIARDGTVYFTQIFLTP